MGRIIIKSGTSSIILSRASTGTWNCQDRDPAGTACKVNVGTVADGDTGAVLVPPNQDATDPGHWFVEDGVLNAAGLDAFVAGRLYVNVHSPAHPEGEVRGQILPAGIIVLHTELTGEQEVPAIDTGATAFAALTLDEAASSMTLHVNTSGLDDATASHLHGASLNLGCTRPPLTLT